ncbi:hypothetical protein ROZALSC1DRAFT_31487 [Rozella allomycis CSF55]|uniref:Uncharacterized protein n=1 Tax=Rozella allomycis (strain CSF55) TaxID=988480 RepID=A0A075ANP2_ROZAC|nr:hypothetical protein O9G_005449 [Rozella allomycis CSF55]RKP16608.1 hypothetical protein ROZALSC1DRAFT_31487 [Rozella allomycis CSF55]|eukprot:EPZ31494.1 hypothetical protein O9G_005449 [Rozella allomycis CSF55]
MEQLALQIMHRELISGNSVCGIGLLDTSISNEQNSSVKLTLEVWTLSVDGKCENEMVEIECMFYTGNNVKIEKSSTGTIRPTHVQLDSLTYIGPSDTYYVGMCPLWIVAHVLILTCEKLPNSEVSKAEGRFKVYRGLGQGGNEEVKISEEIKIDVDQLNQKNWFGKAFFNLKWMQLSYNQIPIF